MVATHEAGHAVAAYLSGVGRRLEVLSIVKRKDALGLLAHNDSEERWTRSRTELLAFLRIACAGMAAEELWFGESTTGPGGDLVGATGIAAQMVGALGMADSLVSFMAMEEGLNERNVVAKVLSDPDGPGRAPCRPGAPPACWPAARPRQARWPIRARAGRFTRGGELTLATQFPDDDLPREPDPPARATEVDKQDPATPEEVPEPEASEVESARLLANQARPELGAAGFSDQRIDELASEFIARDIGEGLEEFLRWARAEGQLPQGSGELF
jgi:hypothetical protein